MKYVSEKKDAVNCKHPTTGEPCIVPRGHRFWVEWGIDTAEAQGRINEPETMAIDGSDSGSSNNGI
ncbi:hypothetical protein AB6E39_00200 [Vibrio splendidus]|uniref:hypothetical protein n=1 Tax=Vibrio splendidus TaxID=29497 RepID=UPI001E407339|nr:hypothetical protein [Vibrio splendidus]MCC4786644.1 hypothetical protein [Vibrio splendidus]